MGNEQKLKGVFKWFEVKNYLKSKYKVANEDENMLAFGFSFGEGKQERSQIVLVRYAESGDDIPWVVIISRIGEIIPRRVDTALEYIAEHICGGMIKIGDGHFIRHALLLNDINAERLDAMIRAVVSLADEVEKNFVGGDEN
jgi:hypothetical protein